MSKLAATWQCANFFFLASYYGVSLHQVPEKAKPTEETSFRIKKIIKKGMHNSVPSVLVQWENYGEPPLITEVILNHASPLYFQITLLTVGFPKKAFQRLLLQTKGNSLEDLARIINTIIKPLFYRVKTFYF